MTGSPYYFKLRLEVDLSRRSHGRLDVQNLNILPSLLKKRYEEVNSKLNVQDYVLLAHLHVTDGKVQAHNFLQLELDGALNLVDLVLDVLLGRHTRGELTRSVKTGSEQSRDQLDDRVGGQEGVVLSSELLHEFLVLVKCLQVVNRHVRNVELLTLVDVDLIGKNADLHVRSGGDREAESYRRNA